MAEVRRRSTRSGGTKTASRRRDRVAEETDEDEDDDVDATPPRRRTAAKSTTRRRRPVPVDEDEADDEEDEEEPPPVRKKRRPAPEPEDDDEDEDDDDDDEDEDEEPPPRKKRRRPPVEEEDEEDDDEDEEPAPKRTRSRTAAKKASTRTTKKASARKLPPGVRVGAAGIEATAKAGGGGEGRITLDKTPILVKILEQEDTVLSFRQHWLSQGKGQGDRAYTCIGKPECPVCKLGDRSAMSVIVNVLNFSVEGEPRNEYLQIGKRAWDSLTEQSAGDLEKGFWSVNKTGKGTSSQTNFRPVKQRDIKEDWPEVLEDIDLRDIPAAIEDAKENLFGSDVVQVVNKKQLQEVSKYLADDEDDEDDDDDE